MSSIVVYVQSLVTAKAELVADYGIDTCTGQLVMLPTCHPTELGAIFDLKLKQWIIHNPYGKY